MTLARRLEELLANPDLAQVSINDCVHLMTTGVEIERTYRKVDLQLNGNGIFDGTEVNCEVAFSSNLPTQSGDHLARNPQCMCMGLKPPKGWVYTP
jgi:hypothetical protein